VKRRVPRVAAAALGAVSLVAGLCAPAAGAGADPAPLPRTGALPSFAGLPEGHVPLLPGAAPVSIPAAEKVDGLAPTPMPSEQAAIMKRNNPELVFSYLFADVAQARLFQASRNWREVTADACLTDGGNADVLQRAQGNREGQEPQDWPMNFQSMLSIQAGQPGVVKGRGRTARATGGAVHAIRVERFVTGSEGHASLDITDAWVDARTRGARVFEHVAVPLARIFTGPNGLEVFAARDEDTVQLVVHVSEHPAEDAGLAKMLRAQLQGLFMVLPDGNNGSTDCGHMRVALHTRDGAGQMATLQSNAFLPPADGDWGKPEDGETEDSRGQRLFQTMRQRPYQLSVSTTTTSADASPVLSVALGWAGRERANR
jgi:hypothetical protein